MIAAKSFGAWAVLLVCGAVLLPAEAPAQETARAPAPQIRDAPEALDRAQDALRWSDALAPSKALRRGNVGTIVEGTPPPGVWSSLLPELSGPTLTWIAVVVILVLTLQVKPRLSWHSLAGLMLALTALLLLLRSSLGGIQDDPAGPTVQWWTYFLLSVAALYWLVRGLRLLLAKTVPALGPNVSQRAMFVLIVAGLFVAGAHLVNAPLSDGSRDGLIGGMYTAETGKLPYGDALGHDARSPLLYLLHAGAMKLVETIYGPAVEVVNMTAVRLANALLLVLLLSALAGIGHRMHSVALGQMLVVVACIFPGVLECLARPEIMLPTVLLAWSIAFVTVPGVGGLLSVLALVLAGLAWPWAWLALPVMLAYFFRRGWQALGATIGLVGGAAAAVVGITALVAPALPRADGALREAGMTPPYAARLSDDGTPVIEHRRPSETIEPMFIKKRIWRPLLNRDELRLDSASMQPALPNGVDARAVRYRDVVATGEAREVLQDDYRAALAQEPQVARMCASLRTVLEATWKPEVKPTAPVVGVWDLWAAEQPGGQWTLIRRVAKIVVGLLALLVALVLIRGQRPQVHQLIGGLLVVCAATLVISMPGAATNWVWLMPAALAALAANSGAPAAKLETRASERPPLDLGPAPRITVEK